jgi:hypothetical protein
VLVSLDPRGTCVVVESYSYQGTKREEKRLTQGPVQWQLHIVCVCDWPGHIPSYQDIISVVVVVDGSEREAQES